MNDTEVDIFLWMVSSKTPPANDQNKISEYVLL